MNNERIEEIAEHSNAWYPDGYPSGEGGDAAWCNLVIFEKQDLQKFMELIVRECLDIALEVRGEPATDTHYVIGYNRACEKMIDGIKEHFGVTEK